VLVIGAIGLAIGKIVEMVLAWRREEKRIEREEKAKAEAEAALKKAVTTTTDRIAEVAVTLSAQDAEAAKVKAALAQNNRMLATTATTLARKVEAVHKLVNGPMTAQVRGKAAALRRVADLTGDPVDHAIALEAEKLLADHVAKDSAETPALTP
jgi:hypothetical protein